MYYISRLTLLLPVLLLASCDYYSDEHFFDPVMKAPDEKLYNRITDEEWEQSQNQSINKIRSEESSSMQSQLPE